MKRFVVLLLAAVMCLSLVACGGSNDTLTTDETEATVSKETEPKLVSVEITLDNWQNYFELREYTKFIENGFGEIDDAETYWTLVSKDEYAFDMENCDVTFEFTYDEEIVAATVDTDSKTVIYGEVTGSRTSEAKVETMNGVGQYVGGKSNERYGEYLNAELFNIENEELVSVFDRRIVNITVIQISGTFSYYE